MMWGFSIVLLFWANTMFAQNNLVPNPSFEENTGCPTSASQIWRAPPWEKIGGTGAMSYYHECAPVCCGIPVSRGGGGYARTGEAYADLAMAHNNHAIAPLFGEGNFLGSELTSSLEADKKYSVTFYLSLMDSARFAGRNIGAHFSVGIPVDVSWTSSVRTTHLLSLTPQVRYEGDFLTDKEGWMPVVGSFIAQGGEDYMTIGNFDGYANSDTLNLHEGGTVPSIGYWEVAFYYIDDVSVVEDTSYHVGIANRENIHFALLPNPASYAITIETSQGQEMSVGLYDMAGRQVFSSVLHSSKHTIGIGHLPTGVYVAVLREMGVAVARRKLVKQ